MDVIAEWKRIPGRVEAAVRGGPLDEPFGPEDLGMTRRILAHHIAEANVVAASIVIAGLGSPGSTYDWSWMMPFGPWVARLDYARKPIDDALRTIATVNAYVVAQVEPLADGLSREVVLRDAPEVTRRATIADVLKQTIDHVTEHVASRPAPAPVRSLGTRGCGNVIAEAFMILGGIDFVREEVDYAKQSPARDELLRLNPLGQVPTLMLEGGRVLTESLAVAAWVDAIAPSAPLVPRATELAPRFWRWATFLVTAIYPTFTYGDAPSKWVPESASRARRDSTDELRRKLWGQVERECGEPYFLGRTFSAIDVYLAVMTKWRPGEAWFDEHCPKIAEVARRVRDDPRLAAHFADQL